MQLNLEGVKPGMILLKPAVDLLGEPLLEPGTVLTEDVMRILRAWGVQEVEVEQTRRVNVSGENKPGVPQDAIALSGVKRRTTRIFRADAGNTNKLFAETSEKSKKTSQDKLVALKHMFAKHSDNRLMVQLAQIVEEQLLKEINREEN